MVVVMGCMEVRSKRWRCPFCWGSKGAKGVASSDTQAPLPRAHPDPRRIESRPIQMNTNRRSSGHVVLVKGEREHGGLVFHFEDAVCRDARAWRGSDRLRDEDEAGVCGAWEWKEVGEVEKGEER